MSLHRRSVEELLDLLRRGECEPADIAASCHDAMDRLDPSLHAFHRRFDLPTTDAGTARGDGALDGIPCAIKANIAVRGQELSCNSGVLEGYRPPYDATVTTRLLEAGAVPLGQTNMDEFAMGSSTENSAAGPTRNPWDPTRTPGGSSGGSAAAVAAEMVPFALGSDTGGSIRQPAGFCGVVGLKPTYGRVSRYGLVAFASSLDQIGPITRTVRDAALVYRVLAGPDPRDSTTLPSPVEDPLSHLDEVPRGIRLGVPRELLARGLAPEVEANFDDLLRRLERDGARLVDVELPTARHAIATYYVLATAEASSNLGRYDGVRYGRRVASDSLDEMVRATRSAGFGREVKLRILLGSYVLSSGYYDAYYRKAGQVRTLMRQDYQRALESCDALLTPTSPTPAFVLGTRVDDPLQMYLSDVFTVAANLTGLPAVAVPSGTTAEGLPLSVQLMGPARGEGVILQGARQIERMTGGFAAVQRSHRGADAGGASDSHPADGASDGDRPHGAGDRDGAHGGGGAVVDGG